MQMNHQAANRNGAARHLGMPGFSNQLSQCRRQAALEMPSTGNQAYQLLDQILNPRSQAFHWVQENPTDWHQAGQKPVSYAELFKAQAEQAQRREEYLKKKGA
jgi:hypothetical protein